jgi:DNA-binding MarR family transcriptional regulator
MGTSPATLKTIIDEIRRCFWVLKSVSDESIGDLGLTASTRAILQYLQENGAQTVPKIAADKSVKRQSIQALVDQLLDDGRVETRPNPAHQRSQLIVLTPAGEAVFQEVLRREQEILSGLAENLDRSGMEAVAENLALFRQALLNIREKDDD